ncbi:MAG: DUF3500 domain-containing protein [Pirellulaceae bacterium]|jgi:hypothetical protein|nr:DUF3500 domain-containing protein [Pirellulaceae bacterium]MDP6557024.1 DUF3500 domain-containing protein [Pirellulaceae bacterium]
MRERPCPDCQETSVDRREFVKQAGATALAASAALPLLNAAQTADGAEAASSESTVSQLYESLTDAQREVICMPINHMLRKKIHANWAITEPAIGSDFYTEDQRKLIDKFVHDATSGDGYELLQKQMRADAPKGFGSYHIAIFGKPSDKAFQLELTGRHLTLRSDGNNKDSIAFGGPIVYGHGQSDPKRNLFHHQTKRVNEVFHALDADQAKQALLAKSPTENHVKTQGPNGSFPGVNVGSLSPDQIELVESVLKTLLAPYREQDVKEVFRVLKATGGLDTLHMAFFQDNDLNDDKVWDIWRVEGPSFVWHFRGAPHVHAYINIAMTG